MRKLFLGLLSALGCGTAFAEGGPFFVTPGQDGVWLGPFCMPELSGDEYASVDFDFTNLVITVSSAAYETSGAFNYTAGNIDDGPNDNAWGNPAAGAIELDLLSVGAVAGCFNLHFRDEVFDAGTDWTVVISDGGGALMDQTFQITGQANEALFTAWTQNGANAALTAFGVPTLTQLIARTLIAADYATAAGVNTGFDSMDAAFTFLAENLEASLWRGVAESGTVTTMTDALGLADVDDTDQIVGRLISFYSEDNHGVTVLITAFNTSTKTVTFANTNVAAVAAGTRYVIWPAIATP